MSVIVPDRAASVFFQNLVALSASPHPAGADAGSCASIVTPPIVASVTVCPHCRVGVPSTAVQFALTTLYLPNPLHMSMSPFSIDCAAPVDDFAAGSVNAAFAKYTEPFAAEVDRPDSAVTTSSYLRAFARSATALFTTPDT